MTRKSPSDSGAREILSDPIPLRFAPSALARLHHIAQEDQDRPMTFQAAHRYIINIGLKAHTRRQKRVKTRE